MPRYVPVHAHKQHSCHECSKDLREYVMRNLFPGKALPDSEANRDGRVKMTTGSRGAGNNSKSDTNSKPPTDLKDTAKGCGIGVLGIQIEGGDGCYAREAICLINPMVLFGISRTDLHIEEDSCSFSHTLPQPTRSCIISVRIVQQKVEAY